MLGIVGYNFLSDINTLDPISININNLVSLKIQNGLYNHVNLTSDVISPISFDIPTDWTSSTLLDCNFDNNISGGSLNNITQDVTAIKIKRRKMGDYNWITIKEIQINSVDDFTFAFNDTLSASGFIYEYAYVPIIGNTEGAYSINQIETNFRGVFVCDLDTAYRFYSGVEYGATTSVQKVGTFEPFGRKYPIVVFNGSTQYDQGSFSGNILPDSFYETKEINRVEIVKKRNSVIKFLNNKKPKILKDHNGNCWLICIIGEPNTNYDNSYGMGMVKVDANWIEIGDYNNATDLFKSNLIPVEE